MINKDILFFDSTLRDGSHAIKHQFNKTDISNYCRAIDTVGLHTLIVGHGNGLGASSLQTGMSLLSDTEMLSEAKKYLNKSILGAFLIPGYGTISDDLKPALDCGVGLVCVASHCTEANVTRQHIEYIRKEGKEVYGILMMCHMANEEELLVQALQMQEYGAMGVLLMDSAGCSTPEDVEKKISLLNQCLNIKIGFHGHNNLSLAVINSYIAIKSGAQIIDGTVRGFGAGAGNCQLETLIALLIKKGYKSKVDLYKLLDVSEEIVSKYSAKDQGINSLNIVSGMSGVFSTFETHVNNAAKRFNVDPRDIFIELGKKSVVGGQEDVAIEVALEISQRKTTTQNFSF